jgi:hypothetical protein
MNNDSDHYDWWIDTDSDTDMDVLESECDVIGDEEFFGFLAGDYGSDAELLGLLGF